ncbi:transcriptional regulator FeaR, partial [Pseudomonas sp. MAFF212428]|nr:transcriptional regulator FeaR [Pseudomonas brassicae]
MNAATAQHQFQQWLADINHACGEFDGAALCDDFVGDIRPRQLGALRFSHVNSAHARLLRTPREVQRSSEHKYFAVFQLHGTANMAQGEAREVLLPGDI